MALNRWWYEGKRGFLDWIGMTNAEAHVHFGIGVFLLLALLLRRNPRGLLLAWIGVLLLQTGNEAMDAIDWFGWESRVNWNDAALDYVRTMLWPSVLLLVSRHIIFQRSRF